MVTDIGSLALEYSGRVLSLGIGTTSLRKTWGNPRNFIFFGHFFSVDSAASALLNITFRWPTPLYSLPLTGSAPPTLHSLSHDIMFAFPSPVQYIPYRLNIVLLDKTDSNPSS
jgi:hypothetical protein